ncbi:YiaA/YiaB family inner membrane protein [Nocardia asiatica]|uniref:YiaA/YiaB family inner membrane protein n=1 Tax=Nocardia asiatica TaxID=209252 RepID=UPI0024566978|nr:YiaA/YiaB family inner membrane protein [Nocardia asiatica]
MSTSTARTKATAAYVAQAAIAFGISFAGAGIGICALPLDIWQRGFLGMSMLFLVTSTFTLAKVVRDQHEAATIHGRIDQARMDKLLAEHDPFNSVA